MCTYLTIFAIKNGKYHSRSEICVTVSFRLFLRQGHFWYLVARQWDYAFRNISQHSNKCHEHQQYIYQQKNVSSQKQQLSWMYRPLATAKWKCLCLSPEAKTVINQQDFPQFSKTFWPSYSGNVCHSVKCTSTLSPALWVMKGCGSRGLRSLARIMLLDNHNRIEMFERNTTKDPQSRALSVQSVTEEKCWLFGLSGWK